MVAAAVRAFLGTWARRAHLTCWLGSWSC